MPEKIIINNEAVDLKDTKVSFLNNGALNAPSPFWAKVMFRVTFASTTAAIGWIAATNLISPEVKYEVTLLLKLIIDPIVYVVSKCFGVTREND